MIRHRYDGKVLSKVRKLETLDFELRKCKLDIEFLETCLKNGLMAKFLNFEVANSTPRNSKSYKDCHLQLLQQQLSNKKLKCRSENNQLKVLRTETVSILSVVDFTHLITVFTNNNDKILRKVQDTHKKKLYNLGVFECDKEFNDPNKVIINFSSYQLNDAEKSLLAKGLNFALPPKVLNRADCLLPFEMVHRDIKTMDVPSSDLDIIKVALKEYTYNSFKKYNFLKELNFSRDEYNALKNLSSLKNIIVLKSDKGKSVVLMNRDDYINQMETLIPNQVKFQKLLVPENKDYNSMVKEKR